MLAKHAYLNISGLKAGINLTLFLCILAHEAKVLTFIVFVKLFEQQKVSLVQPFEMSNLHKSKRNMIMTLILSTKG